MPRRHRRAAPVPELPSGAAASGPAPAWSRLPGVEVRRVIGEKVYRCPGCDHPIRPGLAHLVVVPIDDPDARRHWHTACWRTALRSGRAGG
ncbi:MAG: hypothetical protein KatS3mg013_0012 [Actinomycetota bacterium]|jgi:hypothetical protein|nr:MAG: hypothetical protein KatS3mg013_0012 [Actinomycetota bacterium]